MNGPLFHGGKPGLKPGDAIEPGTPHYVDGCAVCEAKKAGIDTPFDPLNRFPDRVYVTSDREYARFYASKFPRGDLYTVVVEGELTPAGDEDPFPSFTCARAIVAGVVDRYVALTPAQRRRLLNRWKAMDLRRGHALTLGEAVAVAIAQGKAS